MNFRSKQQFTKPFLSFTVHDCKQHFAGRGKEDTAILRTEEETSLGLRRQMLKEDLNLR
jgi:hypothetical protein